MRTLWLVLAGAVGGVLGGMGLGGGTLLIPILTLLFDVPPRLAAWVNLVVFLPTGAVALAIHLRNKMVDNRPVLVLLFAALAGVLFGTVLLGKLPERTLKRAFGVFMISLGSLSLLFAFIREKIKK